MLQYESVVLTVSDKVSRGERYDKSGFELETYLKNKGVRDIIRDIVPDEIEEIKNKLKYYADTIKTAVIFTTGGTGLSPRDITPEATEKIMNRKVPGISEIMRYSGLKYTPRSILSRGVSVIRKKTLIINLPGSPKAALESLDVIFPVLEHAIDKLRGDMKDCG